MNQYPPILRRCIVALTIPIVIATTCIGIGVRHSHEGGNLAHGHSYSHSHTHPHSSRDGHSHTHSHHSPSHDREDDLPNDAHIHVSVFGFILTLSCSSDDIEKNRPAAKTTDPSDVRSDSAASEESLVDLRPDVSNDGLFQFLTFVESVVPDRIQAPHDADGETLVIDQRMNDGRCRDLPQTPPPEWV
jgi:hypothetical protein